MAGRFVSLEEAARLLGVSVDEVNRLVDRKKLFPMRDGAALKFRTEDVERLASDLGDDQSQSEDLSLDLDLPGPAALPAGTDEIVLGDPLDDVDFSAGSGADDAGAQTIVRGDSASALPSSPSLPATASVFDDLGGVDDADLSLEPIDSIVGASSPSLSRQSQGPSTGVGPGASGSLAINLSNVSGSGSNAGSGSALGDDGATMMLSGPLDSGLSLEASGIAGSSPEASVIYPTETSGALGGDEFILGGEPTDEESASVVIPTEETGESSFFGTAIEGEGSQLTGESSAVDSGSVILGAPEFTIDTPFSGLQITGLVCCSLLLLCGGFVVFDLIRTIGSADGPMLANPLLDRIAETFGWR